MAIPNSYRKLFSAHGYVFQLQVLWISTKNFALYLVQPFPAGFVEVLSANEFTLFTAFPKTYANEFQLILWLLHWFSNIYPLVNAANRAAQTKAVFSEGKPFLLLK